MPRTVVLIGASGGIGNTIAKQLNGKYNLALTYCNNACADIELSSITKSYQLNIKYEQEVENVFKQIIKDFGGIDIIINCSGINYSSYVKNMQSEDWKNLINVNLTGAFFITKHAILNMTGEAGRIIHLSSVVSKIAVPGTAAYAASKAALETFVRVTAHEITNANLTINCISPGYMQTGMLYQIPEKIREKIKANIPMKEFGDPIDIFHLIEYLISEHASYITGQTFSINGGIN
jgi:Dehydrogenases with different specificities (related to short-chain alcohol dehydrogenases)